MKYRVRYNRNYVYKPFIVVGASVHFSHYDDSMISSAGQFTLYKSRLILKLKETNGVLSRQRYKIEPIIDNI